MGDELFFRRREDIVESVFNDLENAEKNGYSDWHYSAETLADSLIEKTGGYDDCLKEDMIWAIEEAKRIHDEHDVIMKRLVDSMPDVKYKDCDPTTGRPTKPISWKVLNTPYTL
jgi:hypothetical protein